MKKVFLILIVLASFGCTTLPKEVETGIKNQHEVLDGLRELSAHGFKDERYQPTMKKGLDSAILFNESLQRYFGILEKKNDNK